eukprot:gnl/MRDRNA2_/MRDRNA2_96831_c0_seq1.p1 gnl/MRDRNA2_/MRDRNA2_96831_c0~~gnl/MRDRNA2_/MRDRNA2_96831_c0_seq1.p1  ORF type:complete len:288 (-),score=54.56 gnl/MRDRNA2_/MRDRNA2_96831_c0_seq1:432-1295(-)
MFSYLCGPCESQKPTTDEARFPPPPYVGATHWSQEQISQSPMMNRRNSNPSAFGVDNTGYSMEEARQHAAAQRELKEALTPADWLKELQRGNSRFTMGVAARPTKSCFERRALIGTQFPKVALLGCADSRVPPEIVFDQGLGDLFTVRVAGNAADETTMASLQYAVAHLKVKVILVLGHEGCGAVKAAGLPTDKIKQEPKELAGALQKLKQGLDSDRIACVKDCRAQDREAVVTNVHVQVQRVMSDPLICSKVKSNELMVVGAFYEFSSGIVDFFEVPVTDHPSMGA